MRIRRLHAWTREPAAAIQLQAKLAQRVRLRPLRSPVRIIAGVDCAFSRDGSTVIAGAVVWDLRTQAVLEARLARRACRFPYIPGLLSFRELPAIVAALRAVRRVPDIVLVDAQGLAHPRGLGLASHLGLWLAVPTVGCAKSRLCGDHGAVPARRGGCVDLLLNGVRVGLVLRTRENVRPLFVSPGHLCDFGGAARATLAACTRYRLPEPTRLAHQLVTRARQS